MLRDGENKLDDDKFEMWLNGVLIEKGEGGQVFAHGADIGIGAVTGETKFHDGEAGGSPNTNHFQGLIEEVWLLNEALDADDLKSVLMNVEPAGKLAANWGSIKTQD